MSSRIPLQRGAEVVVVDVVVEVVSVSEDVVNVVADVVVVDVIVSMVVVCVVVVDVAVVVVMVVWVDVMSTPPPQPQQAVDAFNPRNVVPKAHNSNRTYWSHPTPSASTQIDPSALVLSTHNPPPGPEYPGPDEPAQLLHRLAHVK